MRLRVPAISVGGRRKRSAFGADGRVCTRPGASRPAGPPSVSLRSSPCTSCRSVMRRGETESPRPRWFHAGGAIRVAPVDGECAPARGAYIPALPRRSVVPMFLPSPMAEYSARGSLSAANGRTSPPSLWAHFSRACTGCEPASGLCRFGRADADCGMDLWFSVRRAWCLETKSRATDVSPSTRASTRPSTRERARTAERSSGRDSQGRQL